MRIIHLRVLSVYENTCKLTQQTETVAVVFMGMLETNERNINQQSIFDRKSFIFGICFGLFKFYLMEKAVLFGHDIF